MAVDKALSVLFVNPAAEALLGISAQQAVGMNLADLSGFDEELCSLCKRGEEISLFEHALKLPFDHRAVTIHLTPVENGTLLITIEKADGIDRLAASQWKQKGTRAAGVMAAMLAHEVKNPLAGIRGAAQLLKAEVTPEHQALADLICTETDRIRDLLDQVEIFSAGAPGEMQPVNIHEVLQYVIQVAQTGFARHVTFKERYDPSLPPVMGQRDLLVQLFLNLMKNAAEAIEKKEDAVITLATAYRGGSRMRLAQEGAALPIAVTVEDNGPGIAQSIRAHLFEPFVSSKEEGRGLGLAIVAKIASDLGAVVELEDKNEGGAAFTVWLGCQG